MRWGKITLNEKTWNRTFPVILSVGFLPPAESAGCQTQARESWWYMVLCRTTTDIPDQSDFQLYSQCRTTQLASIWKQCPWVTWNTPVGSNQTKTADHVRQICQAFCWINTLWGLGSYGQFWFTGSNTESLILFLSDSDCWMWKSDLGWGGLLLSGDHLFPSKCFRFFDHTDSLNPK